MNMIRFLSIIFTALALGGGLAHLYSLPNKISLSRDAYFTVQQIYRGWQFLGFALLGQLISTLLLAFKARKSAKGFHFAAAALICVIGTLIIFFTFTYPANVMTNNWINAPDNWKDLRNQWEYSHAVGALLNLAALAFLTLSILNSRNENAGLRAESRKDSGVMK